MSSNNIPAFGIASQKKTRFQIEKEKKLKQRIEEEEAASFVYNDFVASFQVDEDNFPKQRFVPAEDRVSSSKVDQNVISRSGKKEMDKMMEEMQVCI